MEGVETADCWFSLYFASRETKKKKRSFSMTEPEASDFRCHARRGCVSLNDTCKQSSAKSGTQGNIIPGHVRIGFSQPFSIWCFISPVICRHLSLTHIHIHSFQIGGVPACALMIKIHKKITCQTYCRSQKKRGNGCWL